GRDPRRGATGAARARASGPGSGARGKAASPGESRRRRPPLRNSLAGSTPTRPPRFRATEPGGSRARERGRAEKTERHVHPFGPSPSQRWEGVTERLNEAAKPGAHVVFEVEGDEGPH